MWRPRRDQRRRLGIEQFECRRLLAVTTSLNSGTLTIAGDATADDVAIVGTANPGEITVVGRNGTLVDGVPQDVNGESRKTIAGVTAHVDANLGNGNNVVNVDNVYLAGHLDIVTGSGSDRIVLGASGVVSTTHYCSIRPGANNDTVRAENYNVFIVDRLQVVNQGTGNLDSVSLVGASAQFLIEVYGSNDTVNDIVLRGVTSGGSLFVNGAAAINNIAVFTSAASRDISVQCASGQNSIYVDTCYAAHYISVIPHSSNSFGIPTLPAPYNIDSTVTVARCQTPQIYVRTGDTAFPTYFGGNDTVSIYGNNVVGPANRGTVPEDTAAHVLYVETGDGADAVSASYNVAQGHWFISLSELDDTLSLGANFANGFVSADGGEGGNRLNLFDNQFAGFAASRFS